MASRFENPGSEGVRAVSYANVRSTGEEESLPHIVLFEIL